MKSNNQKSAERKIMDFILENGYIKTSVADKIIRGERCKRALLTDMKREGKIITLKKGVYTINPAPEDVSVYKCTDDQLINEIRNRGYYGELKKIKEFTITI
jgi:hypothetical protein